MSCMANLKQKGRQKGDMKCRASYTLAASLSVSGTFEVLLIKLLLPIKKKGDMKLYIKNKRQNTQTWYYGLQGKQKENTLKLEG